MPARPQDPEQDPEAGPQADDPVDVLVEECLLRMELEGTRALEDLCRAHPEHAAALRAAIRRLDELDVLDVDGPRTPDRLGEFVLERQLGGGGMGVVYLARQQGLDRRVAVKLVRPELVYFETSRARFRREVEAIARLQHPGIVPVYAVGEQDGVPYFAMEHVDGASLAAVVQELAGRRPDALGAADLGEALGRATDGDPPSGLPFPGPWWQVAAEIVAEVARALEHAHHRGVLHRDVKPSNIMLSRDGRVQLVDFGLARTEGDVALTLTGTPIGSLAYMSPEQIDSPAEVEVASDVYSLGVTFYELLTLHSPHLAATSSETRRRILAGHPTGIREHNPAVPRDLETVCLTAMAPEPGARYRSAAAFARDLGNAMADRPIEARRAGPWTRLRRFARRNPALTALVAVLLLAVPTISMLAAVQIANRDAVIRGEAARRAERIDGLLQNGWLLREAYPDRARAAFEEVTAIDGDNALAVLGLLLLALDERADDRALLLLDDHPDLTARHPTFDLFRRRILEGLGRADEAARLPPAEATPQNAVDHFVAAQFRMVEGYHGDVARFAEAQALLLQAIALSPEAQALLHMKHIEAAGMAQDPETVSRGADAIEALWPDAPPALAFAGSCLLAYDNDRGIALLERAVSLDPDLAPGWLHLAQSRRYARDNRGAIAAFERALALDDTLVGAWTNLAEVLLVQSYGQPPEEAAHSLGRARESADRALALDAESVDAQGALAEILRASGEDEAAQAAFDRLVALSPRQPWSYFKRGRFASKQGRYEDAVRDLQEAVARDDSIGLMHLELAHAARLAGNTAVARIAVQRAAALEPDNPDMLFERASIRRMDGDLAGAREDLERLTSMHPESEMLHGQLLEVLEALGDAQAIESERERWGK